MQHDSLGNPVSAMRDSTLGAVVDFVDGYLAYETRAERIVAAAQADPGCCIANVYAELGLPRLADQARARAESTRCKHPD